MFSFANPLFLLLMPVAAGPLVLHLLSRRKMKRTQFSSLFFLRKLRERRFRWLRLRDILLLILRSLFLASLVFALAGPSWEPVFPVGKIKADAVIIVDDSYSTEPRFASLKQTAARLVQELSPSSRVVLLTPSGQAWDTIWIDPSEALSGINDLQPSGTGRDISGPWDRGLNMIEHSKSTNRRIIIVSDGQKRALDFLTREPIPEDVDVMCFLDHDDVPDNCSILETRLYPAYPLPEEEQILQAMVARKGGSDNVEVSVSVNGRSTDNQSVIPGKQARFVEFRLPLDADEVSVKLEDDSVTADNQAFIKAGRTRNLRIALVGDSQSRLLELALSVIGGFEVDRLSPLQAGGLSPVSYDVLVWDGASTYPVQAQAAASNGLPVLLLLDPDVQDIEGLFSVKGESAGAGFENMAASELFSDLNQADLRDIRIFEYLRIETRGSKPILTLSNGDPLLVSDSLERTFFMTTRFTPDHSDLVFKGLFPTVLQRILVNVAGDKSKREFFIGDTLRVPVAEGDMVYVETPQVRHQIIPRKLDQGYLIEFTNTFQAGFYKIGAETYVINPDPGEAVGEKITFSDLENRGAAVYPLGSTSARKLWVFFLILAVLCLAAEFILIFL